MARRFGWGRRYTLQDTDKDPALQSFLLQFINPTGAQVQHQIACLPNNIGLLGLFAWKIRGASSTPANTPALAAGVGFVSGVGVLNANPAIIVFDTVGQVDAEAFGAAPAIQLNSTGTVGIIPRMRHDSNNINGQTVNRFSLRLSVDGTGVDFPITAVNIPMGSALQIRVGPVVLY